MEPEPSQTPAKSQRKRRPLRIVVGVALAFAIVIGGLLYAGRKQYRTYISPPHAGNGLSFAVEYPSNWIIHDPTDDSFRLRSDDTELTLERRPGLSLQRFWQEKVVGGQLEETASQEHLHIAITKRVDSYASPDALNQLMQWGTRFTPGQQIVARRITHRLGPALDILLKTNALSPSGVLQTTKRPPISHILAIFPQGDTQQRGITLLIESNSYKEEDETTSAYEDLVRSIHLIPSR